MEKNHFLKITTIVLIIFSATSLVGGATAQESTSHDSSKFWLTLAGNAWNYFQPGVGVDATTGLVLGSTVYPYITDWDNALYIQAVVDAEKLGMLDANGTWGANSRIDRVLTLLETRPLTSSGVPYVSYSSSTGKNSTNVTQIPADAGALFAALKNLEEAKPQFKIRVDNIVYNVTNYEPLNKVVDNLLGKVQNGQRQLEIYDYFVMRGFACFWPQRFNPEADAMLTAYSKAPILNYSGITLPAIKLTSDPLLMNSLYFQQQDSRVLNLASQAYLAQEARYNMTGKFTAFSEGNSDDGFIYEWIATSTGTWVIQNLEGYDNFTDITVTPVVFLKVAAGYLALYNTAYAQSMVNFILKQLPNPVNGYKTGIYESGDALQAAPDDGNSLIISAARYALENQVDTGLIYPAPTSTTITQTSIVQDKSSSSTEPSVNHTANNIVTNQEKDATPELKTPMPIIESMSNQKHTGTSAAVNESVYFYIAIGVAVLVAAMGYVLKMKTKK